MGLGRKVTIRNGADRAKIKDSVPEIKGGSDISYGHYSIKKIQY